MNFLVPFLIAAIHSAAPDAVVLPAKSTIDPARASALDARPRLSWFNSLDRSFSLAVSGAVTVTLHSTSGTQIALVHKGLVGEREILRVSEDLPPGVYLLCIRKDAKQTLERVTLF